VVKEEPLKGTYAWTRKRIWRALVVAAISFGIAGCGSEDDASLNYRTFLKINQLKASYYTEPKTGEKYPLVQGSLSNLGGKTLIVVEFTLRFRNNVQHVIYEDHAYPIFVSEFAQAKANLALKPGAKTRFAFKAPKCPPGWQPGAVEIEITKVVFAKNA
jgi:hypothetical protein